MTQATTRNEFPTAEQLMSMDYPLQCPYASHKTAITRILKGFRPHEFGLRTNFNLTQYTQMKGCGCKIPQVILQNLLKAFDQKSPFTANGGIGIGLDSCVVPLRHPGLNLVQTTDFFYPLVDDPYIQGRITAANVLSDLYAMGVSECDNMLMLLGVCTELHDIERDVIVKEFIKGFRDTATLAGTQVRGGQTVKCPWLLLGGAATSVVADSEMLRVDQAQPGDVLVLTKPLGGQVAVNAYEWLVTRNGRIEEYQLNPESVIRAFQQATEQMCRLNRNAAILARKYNAHACTDITGFGIKGHADTLAKAQKASVSFRIESLPIIEYMEHISRCINGNGFNLFGGTSAETSGGLLIAMTPDDAEMFREELEKIDQFPTFVIGQVVESDPKRPNEAFVVQKFEIVTVPSTIHTQDFRRSLRNPDSSEVFVETA